MCRLSQLESYTYSRLCEGLSRLVSSMGGEHKEAAEQWAAQLKAHHHHWDDTTLHDMDMTCSCLVQEYQSSRDATFTQHTKAKVLHH